MTKKQTKGQDEQSGTWAKFGELVEYFELSKVEMRKVTWPSVKETRATSLVVLAFVAAMVLFLGLVDLGLSKTIAMILS